MDDGFSLEAALRSSSFSSSDPSLFATVNASLDALTSALRLYTPHHLAVAFNGGKDATVLLHLYRAALARYSLAHHPADNRGQRSHPPPYPLQSLYIAEEAEFPEVAAFVARAAREYGVELVTTEPGAGFVAALERYVVANGIQAFGLGTREGDPHAAELGNSLFAPSSEPYPRFMRVVPILRWKYGEVWRFLRRFRLPYCELYDEGYTSLGHTLDTHRNPALRVEDAYLPAWMLRSGSMERDGRTKALNGQTSFSEVADGPETAALLVIGNELMKGSIADENVFPAAQMLHRVGMALKKVIMVEDRVEAIAEEVRSLSDTYNVVITSGGIGPTHDDVTMTSLAQAFGESLRREKSYEGTIRRFFSSSGSLQDVHLRMADIPDSSALVFPNSKAAEAGNQSSEMPQPAQFPIVKTRNVYALPGIPKYFLRSLKVLEQKLATQMRFYCRKLYLDVAEAEVAGAVADVAKKYEGDQIEIGSYPYVDRKDCQTILTVEATDARKVNIAVSELLSKLPMRNVLGVEDGSDLRSPASSVSRLGPELGFQEGFRMM